MSLTPLPEPVCCIASSSHFHVVGISVSETVLNNNNNNNNNSLFDPIMKNTIKNTILENKFRYGHPKNHQGLSRLDDLSLELYG